MLSLIYGIVAAVGIIATYAVVFSIGFYCGWTEGHSCCAQHPTEE